MTFFLDYPKRFIGGSSSGYVRCLHIGTNLQVHLLPGIPYLVFIVTLWSENEHTSVFDVHVTVHRDKCLITKPTRCTNFSNLFLEWNSTYFEQFICPSSGVFHCTHSKPLWLIPLVCLHWKTPDDGQRSCSKYVEFHSKNKFEKLLHLVYFIIRNTCVFQPFELSATLSNICMNSFPHVWYSAG